MDRSTWNWRKEPRCSTKKEAATRDVERIAMTELGAIVSGGVTHPPTNTSPVRQPQPETPLAELVRFIERECRQVSVNNGWGQRHARGLADKVLDAIRAER